MRMTSGISIKLSARLDHEINTGGINTARATSSRLALCAKNHLVRHLDNIIGFMTSLFLLYFSQIILGIFYPHGFFDQSIVFSAR